MVGTRFLFLVESEPSSLFDLLNTKVAKYVGLSGASDLSLPPLTCALASCKPGGGGTLAPLTSGREPRSRILRDCLVLTDFTRNFRFMGQIPKVESFRAVSWNRTDSTA